MWLILPCRCWILSGSHLLQVPSSGKSGSANTTLHCGLNVSRKLCSSQWKEFATSSFLDTGTKGRPLTVAPQFALTGPCRLPKLRSLFPALTVAVPPAFCQSLETPHSSLVFAQGRNSRQDLAWMALSKKPLRQGEIKALT